MAETLKKELKTLIDRYKLFDKYSFQVKRDFFEYRLRRDSQRQDTEELNAAKQLFEKYKIA